MWLLRKKEKDKLWKEYEKSDPYQETSWEDVLIRAQAKKILGGLVKVDSAGDLATLDKRLIEFLLALKAEIA